MIRRLFFALVALSSACTLFTDLDGFTTPGGGGIDGSDGSDASDSGAIEAAVEASVCAPAQDFTNDPKNCGSCGHDCRGGACLENSCQAVMLASAILTDHLRFDSTYVYFADQAHLAIKRMPKYGGPIETLATITSAEGFLYEFTLSDDYVYFQTAPGIRRVKKTGGGGDLETVVNVGFLGYLEVHDGFLWYASGDGAGGSTIIRTNLDGTDPKTIVKDRTGIETFAFDGDLLYYGENGQSSTPGSVRVLTLSNGQDKVVANRMCRRLAIDENNVYFLDYLSPNLWTVPRVGGEPTSLALSPSSTSGADLAIDDTSVFWAVNADPGGVLRVAKTGGPFETISSIPEASGLGLDGTTVFWSLAKANQIYFRVR